jgi:hypothetical protein
MAIERRDTRARCFLFGDRRSVEATLALWAAWRDPQDPAHRIEAVRLRGEPANVLATAAGIRAVETLRGSPFGFALRAELPRRLTPGRALETTGARAADAPPDAVYLVLDADDGTSPEARRLRESLRAHLEGPAAAAPVLIVAAEAAETRLRLQRPGRVERVYTDLAAPLLSPIVEAVLIGMLESRPIVVCGQGARVVQAALGAGDLFIEYQGGPAERLDRARLGAEAARVLVPAALLAGARQSVADALAALGVELGETDARGTPEGLVLEPVV